MRSLKKSNKNNQTSYYTLIKELAHRHNIPVVYLEEYLGLEHGTIRTWDKCPPAKAELEKVYTALANRSNRT